MRAQVKSSVRLLILVQVAAVLAGRPGVAALSMDYYGMSCPFAEYIVRDVVGEALMEDPTLAGSLLRLHFHDCFVQGCDASVLLDSTDDNTAEKDAGANRSLRGYEVIDRVKEALEAQCPGVVSCADILALVARDAVLMARGPYYDVPQGRRDGSRSVDADTVALPAPTLNASVLIELFGSHGFTVQDMVALSGGHTLGIAHCASFKDRLQTELDTLEPSLASSLGSTCAAGDSATAPFDETSTTFDTDYFNGLQQRRGLLSSDQTLFESPETMEIVNMFAMNQDYFFDAFQQGMLKMGQLDLKEGDQGEMSAQMKSFVRLLVLVQVAAVLAGPGVAELSMDYYGMSCPFAEYIVRNVVSDALMKDPTLAGSLLRLHFHDCFVQGCDGSVLLDSTDGNTAEKDAGANKSLRGFEVIDSIKEALEAQCPGVVSCADVLALAARDAVFMARGPYYVVPLGRLDGRRSVDSDTFLALPPPINNVTLLKQIFSSH
ncbi:Peroxidase 47, partial [Dichanthelium oligosanthes]